MIRSLKAAALFLSLGLLLGGQSVSGADLTFLKGQYGGKFTGVMLISQGKSTRMIAAADTKVAATKTKANLVVKGTIGSTGYQQSIVLNPNGTARVNPLVPGGSGNLNKAAAGTYKVAGKTVIITCPNPGGSQGTMTMRLNFTNGNSTLSITSIIALKNVETIYGTIVGA